MNPASEQRGESRDGVGGYTCANCHQWFEYEDGWTDEDALAEAQANGFDTAEPIEVVCDDCYRGMGLLQAMLPPSALS